MSTTLSSRVAAFFDVDGTLIPTPSLEYRFFVWLQGQGTIPFRNYAAWLAHAVRVAPRGITAIRQANKMYLQGLSLDALKAAAQCGSAKIAVPGFYPAALERIFWHANRSHAIFLITGTLEPLAIDVAEALTTLLALRGITTSVGLCATRLQQQRGLWTGHIDGEPIFGAAKADAVLRIARETDLDLPRCYAYADSFADHHMLEMVGYPAAVNPPRRLRRLAQKRAWPVLSWSSRKSISLTRPPHPRRSSGLLFRPEAYRQREQDSIMGKVV